MLAQLAAQHCNLSHAQRHMLADRAMVVAFRNDPEVLSVFWANDTLL